MKKLFSLLTAVLFAGSLMATTVTKTVEELAVANSWENGTVVTPFALDEVISVSTDASDSNTGKYYTNGQQIRLYQTGAAKLIITAAEGHAINSITLEYASQNTGILIEAASGETVIFENAQSATFTVGNSGDANNGQARITSFSITYDEGGEITPPEPETKPSTAPAAPAQDEADVMAIFCNHYAENNANFWISGWAGGYEVLDLDGTNVGFWNAMTWECIIDPAHTDDPHDFSNYKTIHIDMWAPLPGTIKFTAEAVAGGNYKEGVVLSLGQGWNNFDIEVANWPDGYDFSNLKCFVFENYQNQAGESFEGNPFAFTNLYFFGKKSEPLPDPTNCAEAAEAALTTADDGKEEYNDGKEYTIEGFVTGIKTEWSEQYKNISFWMADAADGGEVLQAFRAACETAEEAPAVGDKVRVTGKLINFKGTPEFAAGCTFEILTRQGVENTAATIKAVKVISNGQVLIKKGDKTFSVLGSEMK